MVRNQWVPSSSHNCYEMVAISRFAVVLQSAHCPLIKLNRSGIPSPKIILFVFVNAPSTSDLVQWHTVRRARHCGSRMLLIYGKLNRARASEDIDMGSKYLREMFILTTPKSFRAPMELVLQMDFLKHTGGVELVQPTTFYGRNLER